MATEITKLVADRDGAALPTGVTDDGSGLVLARNDGNLLLLLQNGISTPVTVTVAATAEAAGQALAPSVITVPGGETWLVGPWPPVVFNDEQDNVGVSVDSADLRVSALGL